jgi:uncharacterized protein YbaR (Trm112 family)
MHHYLMDMLECPACKGSLDWTIDTGHRDRIDRAEARCAACGNSYPIRDGIGLFLTSDLPREDLWRQAESHLTLYLRQNPDIESQLMQVPREDLNPADQFFRAMALEAQGSYEEAKTAEEFARNGLYTPDYLSCWNSQCHYLLDTLSAAEGPIVDLASGRGYLVEKLAQQRKRPLVASDFSPQVLQRDRRRWEALGLYDTVSLLAFDVRRTPFKKGSVPTLTTNLGLPNIREAGDVLKELRRIAAGTFLAVSHFYPELEDANTRKIREMDLASFLFRRTALEEFAQAGWRVTVENACTGKAHPTPDGVVMEGIRLDALPVAETMLEWCILAAAPQTS